MASDCHTDGRLGTISITTQRSIENLWWRRCSWSFAAENAPVPAHTPSVLARITRHGLLDQNSCPCMQIMIMRVAFATKWGWGWGWLLPAFTHQQIQPGTQKKTLLKRNGLKRTGRQMALRVPLPQTPTWSNLWPGQFSDIKSFHCLFSQNLLTQYFTAWSLVNVTRADSRSNLHVEKPTPQIHLPSMSTRNKPPRTVYVPLPRARCSQCQKRHLACLDLFFSWEQLIRGCWV